MSLSSDDRELRAIATAILQEDPEGVRTARVLRSTFDQLYDGQHTGRYRWEQLHKTEKTHCGTLVEINLHREFKFNDGQELDYEIAGVEIDCKYSQSMGAWMIPPEAKDKLCLVLWADDLASLWSMGIVRATTERLNAGTNRDGKATLNLTGKASIHWLFRNASLPSNILLQLDQAEVERIMALSSGQKRVNEIFRLAPNRIIGRGVIATLAQQEDYMKRVRGNGGSRSSLRSEGLIILGRYKSHVAIANALQVPAPGPGDSIAVRVAQAASSELGNAFIDGHYWRVATAADPIVTAPVLPAPSLKQ